MHLPSPAPTTAPTAPHQFDQAIALQPGPDGALAGHTHPGYANMVGPYGGITAATLLQAVLQHPQRLGDPVALTVNFAGPVGDGPFAIEAQPLRTNRSTQHWLVTQTPTGPGTDGLPATTATVVTALRRPTWGATGTPMPEATPAAQVASETRHPQAPVWLQRYERRPIHGGLPRVWDGREGPAETLMWVRDQPPRPLCFAALAALADSFVPVVWLRRAHRTLIGTVSMTVYFHTDAAALTAQGDAPLLAQARGQGFAQGFFDHSGLLWSAQGQLLASTQQVVYFKD